VKPPAGFDAVTLNHWLWWKLRCHEGSPEDFQKLFEEVIKRARPEFMQIRPYGNIGDRKCDGLFYSDGVVFQVYSPDELKQADVQAKIEEDLRGAYEHWKDKGLTEWIFVYNCRRGLPPDVPGTLRTQEKKYPTIKLGHMSSDALWEMARGLPLQQRSEILGAPIGYEHLFLLPGDVSGDAVEAIRKGHFVVVHDVMSPINIQTALAALEPARPLGPPLHVRPVVAVGDGSAEDWEGAARQQKTLVAEALAKSRDLLPRFAVFSLAPISLAVHLGFLFSDRVEVRPFQFDRDGKVWTWPTGVLDPDQAKVTTSGCPSATIEDECEVALRISLSARVPVSDAATAAPNATIHIEIAADTPSVTWLKSESQLAAVTTAVRTALAAIRAHLPRCRRIHVFAAVPTPAAIILGQAVNPRMDPPVSLYEYSRQRSPRYRLALTLDEANA
jgi:hypothetical protein